MRWLGLVVSAATVLGAIAGYGASLLFSPQYQASAFVLAPKGEGRDVPSLLHEPTLLAAVAERLGSANPADIEDVGRALDGRVDKATGVATIDFAARDADLARRGANAAARELVERANAADRDRSQAALASTIAQEQAALVALEERRKATNAEFERQPDTSAQEKEAEDLLARARSWADTAQRLRDRLERHEPVDTMGADLESEEALELRERRAELRRRLAELSASNPVDTSAVGAVRAELQATTRALEAEAERVVRQMDEQAAALRRQADAIQADKKKAEAERETAAGERASLDQQIADAASRLADLDKQRRGDTERWSFRIIDDPTAPLRKTYPGALLLSVVGGLLGLVLSLLALAVTAAWGPRHRLHEASAPPDELTAASAASSGSGAGKVETLPEPFSTFPDAVDLKGLAVAMMRGGISRVAVFSPRGGGGAPVSVSLARTLTAAGAPSVLVDLGPDAAALRATGVGRRDVAPPFVAAERSAIADAIDRDHFTETHVLSLSARDLGLAGGAEIEDVVARTRAILGLLGEVYDFVVIEARGLDMGLLHCLSDGEMAVVVGMGKGEATAEIQGRIDAVERAGLADVVAVRPWSSAEAVGQTGSPST
ncbi:hypothetical protein SAMN05428963_106215 [Consotaella salsifontis]|uniref:Uncharacterized protein n=2 Tax=Consotaella salsifontis TaxID=1365950 RepID=A0A1T4RCW1_9HYPH|nr:hypothetical protein SAMN05428963_106215 [Consotaella salsifontis]